MNAEPQFFCFLSSFCMRIFSLLALLLKAQRRATLYPRHSQVSQHVYFSYFMMFFSLDYLYHLLDLASRMVYCRNNIAKLYDHDLYKFSYIINFLYDIYK